MGSIGLTFLGILLFATSVFMMMLILVQRGKGGGLTGALGGMGGQSAFGSKAGDVFTRITVITAIIWITLCMITIAAFNPPPKDGLSKKKEVPMTMSSTDEEETDENGKTGDSAGESTSDDEITPEDVDKELSDLVAGDDVGESTDDSDDDSAETTEDDDGPSLDSDESTETNSEEDNN